MPKPTFDVLLGKLLMHTHDAQDIANLANIIAANSIWDAKGDLAVGTGADTASRLEVGTNGQVLTADSAEATGVKWAAGGGDVSAAVILAPTASTRNVVQPTDATVIPFILKGAAAQTANLQEWQNSAGTVLGSIGSGGALSARITPRVTSEASSATSTPTADSVDQWNITALAVANALAAPTGTPTDGQKLIIRIKDNGTARALTWNAIYRAMGTALPSTTVISKTLYLGFIYNVADIRWDLVVAAQEA